MENPELDRLLTWEEGGCHDLSASGCARGIGCGASGGWARWGSVKTGPRSGSRTHRCCLGGKWHVHDGDRPFPVVVTPGTFSTQQEPGRAPSDAVVLFDGKDLAPGGADEDSPRNGKSRMGRW